MMPYLYTNYTHPSDTFFGHGYIASHVARMRVIIPPPPPPPPGEGEREYKFTLQDMLKSLKVKGERVILTSSVPS